METDNRSNTKQRRRGSRLFRREESIEEQIEDLLPDEADKLGKAYDGRIVRRLSRYLRPYTGRLILAIILMIISSLLAVSQPLDHWPGHRPGDQRRVDGHTAHVVGCFSSSSAGSLDHEPLEDRHHGLCGHGGGRRLSQPSFPPSAYTVTELLQ